MSRAFRDTFKQTFCFGCRKFDRRESTVSFTQLPLTKNRQHRASLSPNENVSTYQYSSDYRPSIEPIENNDSKERKTKLQFFNHSTTIPLLNENNLNGLTKQNSCSS
jgi:hypothetical protein